MVFRDLASLAFGLAVISAGLAGACDPTEQPEPVGECAAPEEASARFSVDVGDWPAVGDNLEISATCTVTAAGASIGLDCDDGGASKPVTLQLMASPELPVPLAVDARVEFTLRRKALAEPDRGFFSVRTPEGELLLAGARSYSSVPGDPEFFAPLQIDLDLETCLERKIDDCRLEQKVILVIGDGATSTRVPHGTSTVLPSGHEVRVGRAMLSMSSGDPKVCPLDETTPETYEYLIAAAK